MHRAGPRPPRPRWRTARSERAVDCDPRIYKNCYAVGIPHSGTTIGHPLGARDRARWLPDPSAGLEIFRQVTPERLAEAEQLVDARRRSLAEVDPQRSELFVGLHGRPHRRRAGGR